GHVDRGDDLSDGRLGVRLDQVARRARVDDQRHRTHVAPANHDLRCAGRRAGADVDRGGVGGRDADPPSPGCRLRIGPMTSFEVRRVGWVASSLTNRADAPRQGFLGAPSAWITFEPWVEGACADIAVGDEMIVLTWLDRADRDVLRTYPEIDASKP